MRTLSLRHALRTLARAPFVTIVAVVSLALGIGGNVAIFSLFEQAVLGPLPVREPARLVNLAAPGPTAASSSCNLAGTCDEVFSYPMFRDLERAQASLTGIAAHRTLTVSLAYQGADALGYGVLVSGSYFPLLGVQPALGRLIGPIDDENAGESPVAVLSHNYWRTSFAEDAGVVGRVLSVNGQALTIIGVAPAGFDGTTYGFLPHVFVPITMRSLLQPGDAGFENRLSNWAYLFGRLAPGATLEQARAALNLSWSAILNDVEAPLQAGMSGQGLARFRARELQLSAGARGQSIVHDEVEAPLLLLFGVTAFVLIIACSNVANLLLARAAAREGEMAIRLSLGGGRRQIMGQLLVEASMLAVAGGVVGVLVAGGTLAFIVSLLPPEAAASLPTSLDGTALFFTGAVALGTGLLVGLFPALHTTRPDLVTVLRQQAGQPSGARSAARFRTTLATVQIGLSMALLVSAGLFTKSLYNVTRADAGFAIDRLVTLRVTPDRNGYSDMQSETLFARLEEDLAALPGVVAATAARVPVLTGALRQTIVRVEGFDVPADAANIVQFNEVAPGYFRTLEVPLLSGREFALSDTADSPPVALVNEQFTRRYDLGHDAVGKWMRAGDDDRDIRIVGVVQDTRFSAVRDDVEPMFFLPWRQSPGRGGMYFYVRTAGAAEGLLSVMPGVVDAVDPDLPVEALQTMEATLAENLWLDRVVTVLSVAFAALATLLAAVGLYGVLAYAVARRTREFGLRMALGAEPGSVRGLVLRQVGRMTLAGGAGGLLVAVALARTARALLFELEPTDPVILVVSAGIMTAVAFGAGALPAWRAARVHPMVALRYE